MSLSAIEESGFTLGLDLGQASEFTALAVDQWFALPAEYSSNGRTMFSHNIAFLHRFQVGTPLPTVVDGVLKALHQIRARDAVPVYVDTTGTGRMALELLRDAELSPIGVTITGGVSQAHAGRDDLRVPKRDLAGLVQVGLQSESLKIAADMPLTPTLAKELAAFKVKVNLAAPDSFESWREGEHDDLVLAAALAVWGTEHHCRRPRFVFG